MPHPSDTKNARSSSERLISTRDSRSYSRADNIPTSQHGEFRDPREGQYTGRYTHRQTGGCPGTVWNYDGRNYDPNPVSPTPTVQDSTAQLSAQPKTSLVPLPTHYSETKPISGMPRSVFGLENRESFDSSLDESTISQF